MGPITADQSQTVMGILAQNTDWSKIDFKKCGLQEGIIRNSKEAGRHFEKFLQNGARMNNESRVVQIDRANPINLASFIGQGWDFWKGPADDDGLSGKRDWDPRSDALTEVIVSQIALLTCLREGEARISGEEKLNRLKVVGQIRLGANVFFALWMDYQKNGENSILEGLRKNRDITYLDFFGDILRDPYGCRGVLCLSWNDGTWGWLYRWLARGWDAAGPSAVLAS